MQLSIIDQATMKIEHEGHQSIILSIREFSKTKFISYDVNKNIIDPFKEINLFINTCLKRQQKQEILQKKVPCPKSLDKSILSGRRGRLHKAKKYNKKQSKYCENA